MLPNKCELCGAEWMGNVHQCRKVAVIFAGETTVYPNRNAALDASKNMRPVTLQTLPDVSEQIRSN